MTSKREVGVGGCYLNMAQGIWLRWSLLCIWVFIISAAASNLTIPHEQTVRNPASLKLLTALQNTSHLTTLHSVNYTRPLRFDSVEPIPVESLFNYTYVFGFSTGHCGTTALAAKGVFGDGDRQRQIHFEHEMASTRLGYREYTRMNASDEYRYVQNLLFREIHKVMTPNQTVFYDNGHHTLYFMDGLLKFLTDTQRQYPSQFKYHILRLRRNRVETALSLTFHGEKRSLVLFPVNANGYMFDVRPQRGES
jgi:hypothetical protein